VEISPLDVRNQAFKKKMRGYDPDEVKQFLDAVADRMEQMLKVRDQLDKENAALKEKTEAYAQMEQNLRDTLLTAQKLSVDARTNAEHTAQNIIREAEIDAKKKVADVTGQVEAVARNLGMVKSETVALVIKLRGLVNAHLALIDGVEEEVAKHASGAYASPTAKSAHVTGGGA